MFWLLILSIPLHPGFAARGLYRRAKYRASETYKLGTHHRVVHIALVVAQRLKKALLMVAGAVNGQRPHRPEPTLAGVAPTTHTHATMQNKGSTYVHTHALPMPILARSSRTLGILVM
jgi:hypothetical protein